MRFFEPVCAARSIARGLVAGFAAPLSTLVLFGGLSSPASAEETAAKTAVGPEREQPASQARRLDQLISTLCQVQGVVGPVPEDHPARPLVGLPVSGHAFWYTKITQNAHDADEDFCLFGEVFLNVGGVARYAELNPSTCKIVFDPTRRFGEIEFNLPGSPLSPTRLAFAMPIDPLRPVATGMDELVVSGTCLRKIEPPLVFVN